jgi:hypothetical protein
VSFPFDLQSAVVFDSHMPCHDHAVPMPCHDHAVLKATFQSHVRVVAGERHGVCELALIFLSLVTTRRRTEFLRWQFLFPYVL